MEYQRFDPSGCGFPRSRVPVLAALTPESLWGSKSPTFRALGSGVDAQFFTRGRYALMEAYRQCGVGASGSVLVPAYHCRSMLDPAIRLGAEIGLYGLAPNLSPDLESLSACFAARQQPVKALLLTHFFGFAQELDAISIFCKSHGIALIEDCAHALFSKTGGPATGIMGTAGRFGIASPYKFFPCEDGGVLWANEDACLSPDRGQPQALAQELKGLLRSARQVLARHRVPDTPLLDDEINAFAPTPMPAGSDTLERACSLSAHYIPAQEHLESLAWSRWIMRNTNVDRLASRRRHNYQQWTSAVAHLPHCRALFPTLADDCVPYMFVLYINHPELHFPLLKRLGVPVWRWDDMATSTCEVATDYRLHLLHLPCHQNLSHAQMLWLTTAVAKVLS